MNENWQLTIVIIRGVLASAIGLYGLVVICLNWLIVYKSFFGDRGRGSSPVGLVGGVSMAVALLVFPYPPIQKLYWLPLLCDYGTIGILISLAWFAVFRPDYSKRRKRRRRLPTTDQKPPA